MRTTSLILLSVLAAMLRGAAFAASLPPDYAALCNAARVGDVDAIRKLIAQGADPNFSPKMGIFERHPPGRPLDIAAASAQDKAVEVLLKLGADPCARGDNYDLAVERAALAYDSGIKTVIDARAEDPFVKTFNDRQAESFRKILLLLAPKSTSCSDTYSTPIAWALIATGDEALVRQYFAKHATSLSEDNVQFALQAAIKYHANDILRILFTILPAPANLSYCLLTALAYDNAEVVPSLVSQGAELNAPDSFGGTLLHYAIKNEQTEVAKALLDNGASLNVLDKEGKTPANYAGSDEMKNLLNQYLKERNTGKVKTGTS